MSEFAALEALMKGDRVRVLGGLNFEQFHGGMEGTVVKNTVEDENMEIQFDEQTEPIPVDYCHLEPAPTRGGYRAGFTPAAAQAPKGPMLTEHGPWTTRQLVELHSLQNAQELNGKLGRLRKYDVHADRWEVDVRSMPGIRRLKETNLQEPPTFILPEGLNVPELKEHGNEAFKANELEKAKAYYTAAIKLIEKSDPKPVEAEDPKYMSVLYGNRAQVSINLCREVHGEDKFLCHEARRAAMDANIDAAYAIDLDAMNGKAYYRRGCACLGMAPSASRAKEAIRFLEVALSGRASGGKDGVVLPNALRVEVSNLLEYAKRRLDACTEAAIPDIEQCREDCRNQ